jgi:hypothetical protein
MQTLGSQLIALKLCVSTCLHVFDACHFATIHRLPEGSERLHNQHAQLKHMYSTGSHQLPPKGAPRTISTAVAQQQALPGLMCQQPPGVFVLCEKSCTKAIQPVRLPLSGRNLHVVLSNQLLNVI